MSRESKVTTIFREIFPLRNLTIRPYWRIGVSVRCRYDRSPHALTVYQTIIRMEYIKLRFAIFSFPNSIFGMIFSRQCYNLPLCNGTSSMEGFWRHLGRTRTIFEYFAVDVERCTSPLESLLKLKLVFEILSHENELDTTFFLAEVGNQHCLATLPSWWRTLHSGSTVQTERSQQHKQLLRGVTSHSYHKLN